MMNQYLSDKIKVLSFISIIFVLYIHTYYTEGINYKYLSFIENCIGGGIATIAVPLFYIISGYLLFLNLDGISTCLKKMKKRAKTLLVPYSLANILAVLVFSTLDGISKLIPSLHNIINFHILDWFKEDTPLTILYNIFWTPVAFQLWFVRDMIIFIIFLPLIYYIISAISKNKIISTFSIAILVILHWITGFHIIWMFIGALCAKSKVVDATKICNNTTIAISITIVLCLAIILNASSNYSSFIKPIIPTIGMVCIWILYDNVMNNFLHKDKISNRFSKICSYTFFIYLTHIPFLLILKKIPLLINNNEITIIISYILVPLIYTSIAICIGCILKKIIPNLYYLLTGGR